MSEVKVIVVFILAVVGWFGYSIERERRIKAENKIKKFYGVQCEKSLKKKVFLQNINAADVKKILEKIVKISVPVIQFILVIPAIRVAQWLSLRKQSMMAQLSIKNEE